MKTKDKTQIRDAISALKRAMTISLNFDGGIVCSVVACKLVDAIEAILEDDVVLIVGDIYMSAAMVYKLLCNSLAEHQNRDVIIKVLEELNVNNKINSKDLMDEYFKIFSELIINTPYKEILKEK